MARGEIGARPLLVEIIKRSLLYHRKIIERNSDVTMAALKYENSVYALKAENSDDVLPNFLNYADRFNLSMQNLLNSNREVIKEGLSQNV